MKYVEVLYSPETDITTFLKTISATNYNNNGQETTMKNDITYVAISLSDKAKEESLNIQFDGKILYSDKKDDLVNLGNDIRSIVESSLPGVIYISIPSVPCIIRRDYMIPIYAGSLSSDISLVLESFEKSSV